MTPAPLVETRHIMPGRLRCRLPRLRYDENFALRLQAILEATPGVTGVRLNIAAGCLIIHLAPEQGPPAAMLDRVQEAARQATQPAIVSQLQLRFDVFLAKNLSSYEFLQVQAIKNAWRREPGGLMVWLARFLRRITDLSDRLLPPAVFQRLLELHEQLTGQWPQQWQALEPEVGQPDCRQMRRAPLEVCDRLAQRVRESGLRWGTSEGALLGALGPVGLVSSIPLSVIQGLQMIQRVGLCYGYPPDNEREKLFACAVLAAATAHTPEDYHEARQNLRQLHRDIFASMTKDFLTEVELAEVTGESQSAIIGLAMASFSETAAFLALPLLGVIMGAWGMRAFLDNLTVVAQRAYQLRWLIYNGRVIPLARPGD